MMIFLEYEKDVNLRNLRFTYTIKKYLFSNRRKYTPINKQAKTKNFINYLSFLNTHSLCIIKFITNMTVSTITFITVELICTNKNISDTVNAEISI